MKARIRLNLGWGLVVHWRLGIEHWGLSIGDWGLGIGRRSGQRALAAANPQSPIVWSSARPEARECTAATSARRFA